MLNKKSNISTVNQGHYIEQLPETFDMPDCIII